MSTNGQVSISNEPYNMSYTTSHAFDGISPEQRNFSDPSSSSWSSGCTPNYYGSDFQTFKIIVDVYIVGILCILGITGNTISFFVLRRMKGGTAPRLLQALAAADTAFLCTCLVFQTIRVVFFYFPNAHLGMSPYIGKIKIFITSSQLVE